jgi:hypothetical protein
VEDVLAVDGHDSQSDLCHYVHYLLVGKLLSLYVSLLNQVCQTTAFSILHDDVNATVLKEILIRLNQSRPHQDLQELDFALSILPILLSQELEILQVNLLKRILDPIHLVPHQEHRP